MALRVKTVEQSRWEGGDARIEDELARRAINYTFEAVVSPEKFDRERSRNNQARFESLDDRQVDNYTEAMRRGDKFPPVVAYLRAGLYVIVDGNHRLEAAAKARKFLGVYDVSGAAPDVLQVLAIWFNVKHGKATSEEERVSHALYLIANGATLLDASATVNLPQRVVQRAAQLKTADERFLDCGIPSLTVEKMHSTLKKRLAQITTDEGFVAAVDLAMRARFGQVEVGKLVSDLADLRSSAKQVARIKVWEAEYADEIAGSAGGVFNKRVLTPKTRVNMALSGIENLPAELTTISTSWAPPECDEAVKRMRAAARRLNELAKTLAATRDA